ncbi:MAG: Gfo/Idh/MocA family oxidoreductase [Acidobacteria bacterium]|nr:Gfo/Idh/MocA family oxidoreductase [Acidobacteriota bacterium]
MRVGIIGTGAIANLHARAYRAIGFTVRACTDINEQAGRAFATAHDTELVEDAHAVCRHPEVDVVDLCTLPGVRLDVLRDCVAFRKPLQVQKPIATTLDVAREMVELARSVNLPFAVVSQHRFDDAMQFLSSAIRAGRLGRLLEGDAYVKWHRTDAYYARPVKGSWAGEGGGALINQGIHQVDMLRWLFGPVREVAAMWQLGAVHRIESEDVVNALLRFETGATGVIQASTAFAPGYTERLELHGTKGTAIVSGDRLTAWDVADDEGEPPPLAQNVASGASDPMAISLEPFERQFLDFAEAIRTGRRPAIAGEDGYAALEIVDAVYRSCRSGQLVRLGAA